MPPAPRCRPNGAQWPQLLLHLRVFPQESQATSWHASEDEDVQPGRRVRTEPVAEGERHRAAAEHQAVPAPALPGSPGQPCPQAAPAVFPTPVPVPPWPGSQSPCHQGWCDAVLAPTGQSHEGG